MASLKTHLSLLLVAPALAGCQFSFSAGGPDYGKLEGAIGDELNKSYAEISRQVSTVDCPRQDPAPKAGDTFVCTADVEGNPVRVQVNVTDDKNNVNFSTMDVVFDLADTAQGLARDISEDRGFPVTVTCGEGIKVVEVGQSFECTAADPSGDTRTVKLTAGAVGKEDHWEILGE